MIWIVLGAVGLVALLVVAAALVLVLLADDDDDDDGTDDRDAPAEVVEELVEAAEDGDCDAAEKLVTEDLRATDPCSSEEWLLLSTEDVETEVGAELVDGDHATVAATFTSPQGSSDYTFSLEEDGGEWRVSGFRPGGLATGNADPSITSVTPEATETDDAASTTGPTGDATALPTTGPADVLDAYITAYFSGDCVTADALATERYLDQEGACAEEDAESGVLADTRYKLRDATIDEEDLTATVPVTITYQGRGATGEFELVVVDGEWKVDQAPN